MSLRIELKCISVLLIQFEQTSKGWLRLWVSKADFQNQSSNESRLKPLPKLPLKGYGKNGSNNGDRAHYARQENRVIKD